MKAIIYIVSILLFLKIQFSDASEIRNFEFKDQRIELLIEKLSSEIKQTVKNYDSQFNQLYTELKDVQNIFNSAVDINTQISCLIRKEQLKEQIDILLLNEESDISKIRYIKGLQIIKILYEKTLALDHHFASVSTFSEINKISNPNHYPAFTTIKDQLRSNNDKKKGFDLTEVLGRNIYTSVAHSLISLFTNSNTTKSTKEASLKQIECILDFTLRMHNDLNTIYFETIFLQKNNEDIMAQLQLLFEEFTKPINYNKPLVECRKTDDWDSVREHLAKYIKILDSVLLDPNERRKAQKMQINLEFPIDRLLQFIAQYNSFIDQGAKFYEKFGIMLDSYENEQQCAEQIPIEYQNLKSNIATAIEKFHTAYKPIEINGSKMKEILYGINEYE